MTAIPLAPLPPDIAENVEQLGASDVARMGAMEEATWILFFVQFDERTIGQHLGFESASLFIGAVANDDVVGSGDFSDRFDPLGEEFIL